MSSAYCCAASTLNPGQPRTRIRSPSRGRLTGTIRRGKPIGEGRIKSGGGGVGPQVDDEYLYAVVDALDTVGKEVGRSVPQVALNWLLQRPTVANVVIGARNESQSRDNLGALGWNLTPAQVAALDAASRRPRAYPYWHQRDFVERNPPPVA